MSGNPFDASGGEWLVVVNASGQHALWLPHLDLPTGWKIVYAGPDRAAHWTSWNSTRLTTIMVRRRFHRSANTPATEPSST